MQQYHLNSMSSYQQTNSWTGQSEKTLGTNNSKLASNLLFNNQNMFSNNNNNTQMGQVSHAPTSADLMLMNHQQTENNSNPNLIANSSNNNTHHFFNLTQVNTPFTMLNPNLLVNNSSSSECCDKSNMDSCRGGDSASTNVVLMNNACIFCKLNHKKCDRVAYPGCTNCMRSQKQCVYAQARKRGPKTMVSNTPTGAVEYQFVDDSSIITERKKAPGVKKKEASPPTSMRRESRYINERAYLNNLKQIELDRKYFDNISVEVYKNLTYTMVPPSDRDELMYWLSVSITGRTDLDNELEDKIDPREPLSNSKLAFLYLMHAISFFRIGNTGFAKIFFQKGREFISKCFDQTNDGIVIYTYSLMAYYLLGAECGQTKCSSSTACSKSNTKCYGDCVARSKYFYSICTWYLKERENNMDEHCFFIRQGICVSALFYFSESIENEIDSINKKIANNLTFGDILDFDEYSKFVVEGHVTCLNTCVSSPVFNQIKSNIMSKTGEAKLFNLEEPVQRTMTKLDTFLKIFAGMNSDRTYTFLIVCLGFKAMILFKQQKYGISSSVETISAANEITKATQLPYFKYCQPAAIYAVEVASKIHYDSLSNLLNDPSINLLYDYVEELAQYLYQDLRNLRLLTDRSPLLYKRYLHLQMHISFCLDLYEETKRNHPHRFLRPVQ